MIKISVFLFNSVRIENLKEERMKINDFYLQGRYAYT